jgi:predicted ATPase
MIERLVIENLGPIQKAEVELTPLTVLLGANAAGKTSVLRAFELFADLRRHPLDKIRAGGSLLTSDQWPSIVHRGDETKSVGFQAWLDRSQPEPDYHVRVGIDWPAIKEVNTIDSGGMLPTLLDERLRDADSSAGWVEAGPGEYSIRTLRVRPSGNGRSVSIPGALDSLSRHPTMAKPLADLIAFAQRFGKARYFKPVGSSLLTITSEGLVLPAGEGFVDALSAWQNARVEDFLKLEVALREIFPHIRRIRILRPDGDRNRHSLAFETTRSKRLTPAELEADGVLTTLFLLWAAFTAQKDGILLLDEPEAGLHPHLMGRRVEFLRGLAEGKLTGSPVRVIAATQSVEFVRFLDLSEVRVVEYSEVSGTTVRSVPKDENLTTLLDRFQRNVGELWYSGALGGLPEAVR